MVNGSGLQVIDIFDPLDPRLIASLITPGWASGVTTSGDYAYVADRNFGLQVIDISIPSKPRFVGLFETPDFANNVTISNTFAYVTQTEEGLVILPTQCQLTSVEEYDGFAGTLNLRSFPNPSFGRTTITFQNHSIGSVRTSIMDLTGRQVRLLSDGFLVTGHHKLSWDGCDSFGNAISPGIFWVRVATAAGIDTGRLTILR